MEGNNICSSLNSLSIIKVIIRIHNKNENENKFIFVGSRSTFIKTILTKLEKNQKLTTSEHKELEKAIPFYEKKFGNLESYNIFFIYKYFEENLSIYHSRIIIYETIKEKLGKIINVNDYLPDNILLYKYSRNMDYKQYVKLINYIFEDSPELELDSSDFFNKLFKITFLTKDSLNTQLKTILANKYKSLGNEIVPFLNQDKYTYENCLNNDDMLHLLLNTPILLSQKYNYQLSNKQYSYFGYQNIDELITLAKSGTEKDKKHLKEVESKFFIEDNINSSNTTSLYFNLEYYGKTRNNEYFIISQKELSNFISSKPLLKYYFPEDEIIKPNNDSIQIYNITNTKFKLHTINKQIYNNDILVIQDCFCRNIIFDSLSEQLLTKYTLANLYNNLATDYYRPVIKYISDGEVKYIKLNKKFMLNHSYLETNKLIINTDTIFRSNKFIQPGMDFIQYKWRISKTEILTVNFYENGYSTIYFDNDNNINLDKKLFTYLQLVSVTIKTFKKIINARNLKLPNISNIFNENAETINYSKLLSGNIIINTHLDTEKLQTKEEAKYELERKLKDDKGKDDKGKDDKGKDGSSIASIDVRLLISRIRKYMNMFHHFIVLKTITTNTIKFFYKQVNNFYSDISIATFLKNSFKSDEERQDKNIIAEVIKKASYIFYTTETAIKKILENLDNFTIKSNEQLLYGIEIEMKITTDGKLDIYIQNIDKYYNVRLILFYIKTILSQISHDIETGIINDSEQSYLDEITKKHTKSQSIIKKSRNVNQKVNQKVNQNVDQKVDKKIRKDQKQLLNNLDDIDIGIDLDNFDDIDIDIGNISLDVSNKLDTAEINYDLNLKDLSRLIQLEGKANGSDIIESSSSSDSDSNKEFRNLELAKLIGKNKKMTFTDYMKQMRIMYDKALFAPDSSGSAPYKYSTDCQASNAKQPYIVSERDIQSYDDPEAFNGYLKYRGNYYICPRIWDYMANKPISVRKFIENGLKSPYSKGTYIPPETRGKIELDEKHTVIIRKPTGGTEWEEHNKYPNWPNVLKGTEKEAYPYLMMGKNHPQKLCVPCCGSKKPEDYDPNKREIQQILKPIASKACRQKYEEDQSKKEEAMPAGEANNILMCSNTMEYFYITNESFDVEKCRFGLLPKNLDIMLNNHQNLFLKNQQLLDNSNLFLRIGIDHNKKENILESFAVISSLPLAGFKKLIVDKLTPEVFINLNNGDLIDIYTSNNILPNSLTDYERFEKFMTQYQLFFNILDIDYKILDDLKYKDIELLNIQIDDNTKIQNYITNAISSKINKPSIGTAPSDDLQNLKKVIIAYKIYSAFYNYLGHILDDNEYKNYTHFIDLFSQSIEWLNKEGVNILIFDKIAGKLMCNPYNDIHRSKFVILIQEEPHHFVPVVHITSSNKGKKIWNGIFQYNKVNINDYTYNYFEKLIGNKKLLDLTRARENNLLNLTILHSSICKYQYINNTNEFITELENNDIKIINQIAGTTSQVEFIKLEDIYDNLIIPIYPIAISARKLTSRFKIIENTDLVDIEKYISLKTLLKAKLAQYGYRISKIYYDENAGLFNSIQFVNNLIVPIKPLEYNITNKNKIIDTLIEHGELKGKDDTRINGIFKQIYFNFQLEMNPSKDIVNLHNTIYKDFIYNYFKFDFSRILQENSVRKLKDDIHGYISKFNKSSDKYQEIIDRIISNIISIMQPNINPSNKEDISKNTISNPNDSNPNDSNPNDSSFIKLKVCSKTKKTGGKCDSRFCSYNEATKQCHLNMNNNQLEYFAYLLANDLMNNKMEFIEIMNGSFIPEYNMKNKIFRNPEEIILNVNELTGIIEKGIYSKYKKKLTINEFLLEEDEYIFNKDDYALLEKTNLEQFKKIMNKVIPELVDLSIKNIYMDDKIFTTPFDKTGKYDHGSNIGHCVLPFFDKNKHKFVYQCVPRTGGLMCPTKVDFQRKPDKWGYCPEKIEDTKRDLKVIDIETVGGNEYHAGRCNFPFVNKETINKYNLKEGKEDILDIDDNRHSIYKLKYDCIENKAEQFKWCPLKPTNPNPIGYIRKSKKNLANAGQIESEGDLLRAADKIEKVRLNKWYNGKLSLNGLLTKKYQKGYCEPPPKTKKLKRDANIPEKEIKQDINTPDGNTTKNNEITLDNYIPNNCSTSITPSKGGYKREQLFDFGRNHLKIPYSLMLKPDSDIILDKGELCRLINTKFREFKTRGEQISDLDKVKSYQKDIDNCEKGESKGGYDLKELKELAINYFDINETKAKEMTKPEICTYIRNEIKRITSGGELIEKDFTDKQQYKIIDGQGIQSGIYPGDIELCKETPNRGGFNSKKIKQIARDNFNIDTEHKHKDTICDEIKEKIKEKKIIGLKTLGNGKRATKLSISRLGKIDNNNKEDLDIDLAEFDTDFDNISIKKNPNNITNNKSISTLLPKTIDNED